MVKSIPYIQWIQIIKNNRKLTVKREFSIQKNIIRFRQQFKIGWRVIQINMCLCIHFRLVEPFRKMLKLPPKFNLMLIAFSIAWEKQMLIPLIHQHLFVLLGVICKILIIAFLFAKITYTLIFSRNLISFS